MTTIQIYEARPRYAQHQYDDAGTLTEAWCKATTGIACLRRSTAVGLHIERIPDQTIEEVIEERGWTLLRL